MRTRITRRWFGAMVTLVFLGTACAGASAAGNSGSMLRISAPANGATVSVPFTIKVTAGVPLGDPATGRDHIHFCFDGADCNSGNQYQIAYGDTLKVTKLSPGTHTIEASLRNADHSAAGATATITVTVGGAGGSGGASAPPPGYGY